MIYDMRTYTCRPGTVPLMLKLYEEYGYAPQTRHLGKPVFYGTTETGDVNKYVHIWAYQDAADRAQRRAAMMADPDWQKFLSKAREAAYLVAQENSIMMHTPFMD